VLLLITGSSDGTSNLIVERLKGQVFRYNFDLYKEYDLKLEPDYWEIKNPSGLKISSETVSNMLWWKAFNYFIQDENEYITQEVKYIFREIYAWGTRHNKVKGNPPDFHNKLGKINILGIAKKHFKIPKSTVSQNLYGADTYPKEVVVKSLASGLVTTNLALFTTAVEKDRLDPQFPWFIQTKIDATKDITVFVCGEKHYAFHRKRDQLKGVDWRHEQNFGDLDEWKPENLSTDEADRLNSLKKDLKIDWGRLDFMRDLSGDLIFLEFNANGQWVFLDYRMQYGILDQVGKYLTS